MASLNKVQLIGNLGNDPEGRDFANGGKVVNFRVATTEKWTDKKTGEVKDRTEWHQVAIFNERLADVAEKYLTKGSRVYVEGELQTRKWTDKDGNERFSTEVVLTRFRGELILLSNRGEAPSVPERSVYRQSMAAAGALDDDLPF